jgi:hypothetical protein
MNPAGSGDRLMCRRKESRAGAEPDAAGFAIGAGCAGAAIARLRTTRSHVTVCGDGRGQRYHHQQLLSTAPASGTPTISQRGRCQSTAGRGDSSGDGQLRHPQGQQSPHVVGAPSRYHVHFTPTSGSWLNLVERLFAEVTERCVRRSSHTAVRQLEEAMLAYLDQRNRNPKPFVWKADADLILGKVERLCQRISNSGH